MSLVIAWYLTLPAIMVLIIHQTRLRDLLRRGEFRISYPLLVLWTVWTTIFVAPLLFMFPINTSIPEVSPSPMYWLQFYLIFYVIPNVVALVVQTLDIWHFSNIKKAGLL